MLIEDIKAEIKRLVRSSLESPFIGQTSIDLVGACDLYKRQLEHLGLKDVEVKAAFPPYPEAPTLIELEVKFTPPPEPITISFTVSPAVK